MELVIKLSLTAAVIAATVILQRVLRKAIDRYSGKKHATDQRMRGMHKLKTGILYFLGVALLILIWGFSLANIWVTVTGFIGLVAIGFFAVWSVLSNLLAGTLLFFSQKIPINTRIEIIPDGVSGTVADIGLFFILLVDDEGNETLVPNNLVYQKMVKRLSP